MEDKMSRFLELSNAEAVNLLFKQVPTKYRKYKAGFLKETWITGNYLVHNHEDFTSERALDELGVDSKLAQIAIKHHLQAIASKAVEPKTKESKKKTKAADSSPKKKKEKTKTKSTEGMTKAEVNEAHGQAIVEHIKNNKPDEGYVSSLDCLEVSKASEFNFKKQGFKRYTNFLESVEDLVVVKNLPEIRVYLLKDFEKLNVFQNLTTLIGKNLRGNPIQPAEDVENMVKESKEFEKLQETLPNIQARNVVACLPRFQTFVYQKMQMVQDKKGKLGVEMKPIEKRYKKKELNAIKDRFKADGFKFGRINFPEKGLARVLITPPRDAYRLVRKYNKKVVEEIADVELEVTISPLVEKADKSAEKKAEKKKDKPKKSGKKKKGSKKQRSETAGSGSGSDQDYVVIYEDGENGGQKEPEIQYDPALMLFMNKIPRKIKESELIEELKEQGLMVQNKIKITRGFINPLVLETVEQCEKALSVDVMIQGMKANVQKIKPKTEMKKAEEELVEAAEETPVKTEEMEAKETEEEN